MKYYMLEPEVAGGFGPNAILDNPSARPPQVSHFHYEFDVWLGDPLLEAVACFIVTESLKQKIAALQPTGVAFGVVEVSKSGEFEDLYPDRNLPKFAWLKVTGKAGEDDFGLSSNHCLVVSQRILDVLRDEGLSHCDVSEFKAGSGL
jgi:hypothetical protein